MPGRRSECKTMDTAREYMCWSEVSANARCTQTPDRLKQRATDTFGLATIKLFG